MPESHKGLSQEGHMLELFRVLGHHIARENPHDVRKSIEKLIGPGENPVGRASDELVQFFGMMDRALVEHLLGHVRVIEEARRLPRGSAAADRHADHTAEECTRFHSKLKAWKQIFTEAVYIEFPQTAGKRVDLRTGGVVVELPEKASAADRFVEMLLGSLMGQGFEDSTDGLEMPHELMDEDRPWRPWRR